jgi:hypothetical protein
MGRRGFLAGLAGLLGYGVAKGAVPCEVTPPAKFDEKALVDSLAHPVTVRAHPLTIIPMDDSASLEVITYREDKDKDVLEYVFSDGTKVIRVCDRLPPAPLVFDHFHKFPVGVVQ